MFGDNIFTYTNSVTSTISILVLKNHLYYQNDKCTLLYSQYQLCLGMFNNLNIFTWYKSDVTITLNFAKHNQKKANLLCLFLIL